MSTSEINARQCVTKKAPYINFCAAIFAEEMFNSAVAPEKTSGPEKFENLKRQEQNQQGFDGRKGGVPCWTARPKIQQSCIKNFHCSAGFYSFASVSPQTWPKARSTLPGGRTHHRSPSLATQVMSQMSLKEKNVIFHTLNISLEYHRSEMVAEAFFDLP